MVQTLINNQIEKLCKHNNKLMEKTGETENIATVSESIIKMTKLLQEIQCNELIDPAYSVEKVAQLMDVSTQKVRDLCRQGKLIFFRAEEGSLIKIRASKYNEYILSRELSEQAKIDERNEIIEQQKKRNQNKVNQVS